jgi:hypothetical protein
MSCPKCKHSLTVTLAVSQPEPPAPAEAPPPVEPIDDDLPVGRRHSPPRWAQRVGGVFVLLIGSVLTVWSWHMALTEGRFYRGASVGGPAFAVIGLAMVLFPTHWLQWREEEDGRKGLKPLGCLVAGVGAGLGLLNYLVLRFG